MRDRNKDPRPGFGPRPVVGHHAAGYDDRSSGGGNAGHFRSDARCHLGGGIVVDALAAQSVLAQAGAVRDGVRDVALVEGAGEEGGRKGAERVHGDVFAAVGGPLAGDRRPVHLIAVVRRRRRVHRHDAGSRVAGAVAIEDRGVGLAVDVGHFAVRTWKQFFLHQTKATNDLFQQDEQKTMQYKLMKKK